MSPLPIAIVFALCWNLAIAAGSHPASCKEFGPPPPAMEAIRIVAWFSRIIAQEAIISETTNPAPCARASVRNGRSVTPDIGARITGVSMHTSCPS